MPDSGCTILGIETHTMTSSQSAAVSEGFCEPCRAPLTYPVAGADTAHGSTTVITAATCPRCHCVYVLSASADAAP